MVSSFRSSAMWGRFTLPRHAQPSCKIPITDAAVFDFGVQDTGRDGASWALANRGVPIRDAAELEASPDVALVWTLRAAPHYYRRSDLAEILAATSPLSDKDAAKRVIGADKPLKAAGIPTLAGLAEVATQMRHVVTGPLVKGEVSTQLTARLDRPTSDIAGPAKRRTRGKYLSASAPYTPGSSWSRAPRRLYCVAFRAGRGVRRDPHPTHWPRLRHFNRLGITSGSSVPRHRMMWQPSWTRPSPRSRRIGRRM
jgi:hypothetical protein